MSLIKNQTALTNRFLNPGVFEEAFFTYLSLAGEEFDQDKTLMPITFIHAQNITGDSVTEFFEGSTAQSATNYTNLDQFVRPDSEHAIILAIRVREAISAAVVSSDWTEGATAAAIKNSDLSASINGVVYLRRYDMNEALDSLTTWDNGLIPLNQPMIWPGQTRADFEVKYRGDIPILNQNLKISLMGLAYTA